MTNDYDPRKDKTAPVFEKNYYDFFETCLETKEYYMGLKVLEKDSRDIPKYMVDKFKPIFEGKLEKETKK